MTPAPARAPSALREAEGAGESEGGEPPGPGAPSRRDQLRSGQWSTSLAVLGLWCLLAIPLIVALGVLFRPRWYPIGDLAQTELRVRDVGTGHPPLIGLAGRIGTLGRQGSHPGPLSFWALWPFYELFGTTSFAMQAATASLHLIAVGVILWIAQRRGGVRLVVAVGAVLAILLQTYGPSILTEAWNPYLPVVWWFTFLLAVWSVLADDLPMLPVAVFAGSFCMQTHLSYVGLVPGLAVLATAAVIRSVHLRRRDPAVRRRAARWALAALALGALLWLPPVIEQLTTHSGNLSAIWHEITNPPDKPIGLGRGVRLLVLYLNPWRLVATDYGLVDAHRAITGSLVPGLLMLAGWLATVAAAWRLRHQALLRLHAVLAVTLILGVSSLSRIHGIIWFYLLLWALGATALVVLAAGWTLAVVIAPRLSSTTHARASSSGNLALVGVAVVFTLMFSFNAAHAKVPNPPLSRTLGQLVAPTARALAAGSVPGGGRHGRYLVTWTDPVAIGTQGFGLMNELERRGFQVGAPEPFAAGVTPHRALSTARATAIVHLSVGADIETWRALPGVREVVYLDPRTPRQRAEFARLRLKVMEGLRAAGLPEQAPELDRNLFTTAIDPRVPRPLKDQMTRMLDLGLPTAVFVGPPATQV